MNSISKSFAQRVLPQCVWTRLRLARLRSSIRASEPRSVEHSYGGFFLNIHLSDPLAEGWYDHDWPELPEIALLKRYRLRPGARVFDLGAHQCVVALMMAKIVGPSGLVVALEANSHNATIGRRNRDLNKVTKV
jgi:hypothetical protein